MSETLRQVKYAFHLIFHPFSGFWDLKHEKKGSLKAAFVIAGLLILADILKVQFTGFLYNPEYDGISLNIFKEAATTLGTLLLWCVGNWSLTTLMDGEGSFKDIFIVSAYALWPMIIVGVPLTFLSNAMPSAYAQVYDLIRWAGIIWSGFLMLSGTMVVHQYTMSKTVLTSILIVIAMLVIIFLLLLFFNLLSQLTSFIGALYWEIALRMA